MSHYTTQLDSNGNKYLDMFKFQPPGKVSQGKEKITPLSIIQPVQKAITPIQLTSK